MSRALGQPLHGGSKLVFMGVRNGKVPWRRSFRQAPAYWLAALWRSLQQSLPQHGGAPRRRRVKQDHVRKARLEATFAVVVSRVTAIHENRERFIAHRTGAPAVQLPSPKTRPGACSPNSPSSATMQLKPRRGNRNPQSAKKAASQAAERAKLYATRFNSCGG